MTAHESTSLQEFVERGASFCEVVDYLSRRATDGTLTPLNFLRALQEELGISFVEARPLLEYFDPRMRPIADINVIDELGGELLARHRHRNVR
ncbi:hypothetical protein ACIF6I_31230 [Streptomyces microflavus]|uniref:hypothetical protein n=1 Tax=Streptomyces microflavus TaxID=1919 RepID=UPI003438C0BE